MTSFYVYYRVEPDRLDAVRDRVRQLFGVIESATGIRGRWMRRRDEPGTYMEVYENVADEAAFEALLAQAGNAMALERHIERFVCA